MAQKVMLHFSQILRLLEMIPTNEWNARSETYAGKLADKLQEEGYAADAELIRNHIKMRNGEKVAMAVQDDDINVEPHNYVLLTDSDGQIHEFKASDIMDAANMSKQLTKPGGIFESPTWRCTVKEREHLFYYDEDKKKWIKIND